MAYNLTLNNQQLQLSLARTGGQGSQGNSVTSASIDSNGDFHIIISNASGQQVQDINLGGANIIGQATAAKNAAEAALDTFDDRFLGVKSSAPGLDNDNDALVTGALYFDSTISHLGVYNGSTWIYPLQAAQTSATAAAASETAAATSETNAGTSETNAATSATNAANSAAQAASSESTVAASATTASTAATNALASQSAAASSEANAATSETNSGTSETNAGNSATAAAASGVYADNRATAAAVSAAAALVSENNSATSESSAASSATTAGIHSTNAAANAVSANNSKTAAATSETNALNYQSGAQTSETNAATSETNAASSATAAATSATNSANSATASATSASAAQTAQAATELVFDNFDDKFLGTKTSDPTVDNDGNALVEGSMYYNSTDNVIKFYSGSAWQAPSVTATNAATSATTSASNASTSATNAATSETNAATSAASSLTSANNAAASYDSFDDRYLGAKSSAPTTDNDGNSLLTGALYWNSTLDKMYVYTGAIWTVATGSIPGIKMEFVYTATAGQTAFTGSDDNSETLVMDDTKLVDVFLNGIRLVKGTDYTLNLVTDTVTFATGRTVNDMVVVQVFGNLAATGLSISGANLTGGTINNAVIGGTTPAAGSFTTITATGTIDGRDVAADGTKLDGIETSADVTDTTNVTAAGALMDSEVTNLAQVKAFDSSDYATAAQGTTADAALPKAGGTMTGNISLGDNDKAIFGAGSDLQIYSTGANGFIENNTGLLILKNNSDDRDIALQSDDGSGGVANYLLADGSAGSLKAYHYGDEKLATTNTGVDITGTLTSDGLQISATFPTLILDETNTDAAYQQTQFGVDNGSFRIQTRTSTNTFVSNDYLIDKDAAGATDHIWRIGNTERMRIDSSGSAGIGTSSPAAQLHVNSGASNLAGLFESTDAGATITLIDNATTGGSAAQHGLNTVGDQLEIRAVDSLSFETGGAGVEKMRIDSSGNLGIGTDSPSAVLHVSSGDPEFILTDTATGVDHSLDGNSGTGYLRLHVDKNSEGSAPGFIINVAGSEAMRIDSSGNLGIGTSSIASDATVHIDGTDTILLITEDSEGDATLRLADTQGNLSQSMSLSYDTGSTNSLKFIANGTSERMRLDSSGNLLVGKTSSTFNNTAGIGQFPSGRIYVTRDGGNCLYLNRVTSDGDIAAFYKDGSIVGSIGSEGSGGTFFLGSGDVTLGFNAASDIIFPRGTNAANRTDAISLGNTNNRFKDLYLSGGVYLGGTGSANNLDDYEDGSWTPAIDGLTLTNSSGTYTKIGTLVTAQFTFVVPTNTSTANAVLSGIPFTAASNTAAGRSIGFLSYNPSGTDHTLLLNSGAIGISFRNTTDGGIASRQDLGGEVYWGTLVYRTSQ
jgi:hypothetical protein